MCELSSVIFFFHFRTAFLKLLIQFQSALVVCEYNTSIIFMSSNVYYRHARARMNKKRNI